jgi:hypothetical protein
MKAHQRKQGIDGRQVGFLVFHEQIRQPHRFQAKILP